MTKLKRKASVQKDKPISKIGGDPFQIDGVNISFRQELVNTRQQGPVMHLWGLGVSLAQGIRVNRGKEVFIYMQHKVRH